MQVDGHFKGSRPFPDHPKLRFVEILPAGTALYHGALKSQLFYRPLELIGGSLRVLSGQTRETCKAPGVFPDDLRLYIVDLFRFGDGGLRVSIPLNAGG